MVWTPPTVTPASLPSRPTEGPTMRDYAAVYPSMGAVSEALRSAPRGSLTADDFEELQVKAGRNHAPELLHQAWFGAKMAPGELAGAAVSAWTSAEYPQEALGRQTWLDIFADAGFSIDGRPAERPAGTVQLFRGATHKRRRMMAWTTSREVSESFAHGGLGGRGLGQVWTTTAPPAAMLAIVGAYGREGEDEYIIDTRGLTIVPADRGRS